MPPVNIVTTTLPEYVDQNRIPLIREVVLEGVVLDHLTLQTGIKSKAALNYLKVDTVFQNGRVCGFTPKGTTELTQREISVTKIKINDQICPDTLIGKWAEYEVRTSAIDESERMPFEEFIAEMVVADAKAKRDLVIWQGDTDIELTDDSTSEDIAKSMFDGFLKKAAEEAGTVKISVAAGTSAFATIKKVAAALPAKFRATSKIFVSPEFFFAFVMELVDRNFYHYSGPQDEAPTELVFPGTRLRVIQQEGLAGVNAIYASQTENMFFGTDLLDDIEEIKIWFSDDDDVWKYKIKFTAGVEVAFPDRVVLATLAETPDAGEEASTVAVLSEIAENTAKIADNTGYVEDPMGGEPMAGAIVEALNQVADAINPSEEEPGE